MGRLVDGVWHTADELADISHGEDGEFERQESAFREWIEGDPDATFPAEPGRYHLYVSSACPWAHRTLVTRALLGLEDAITVDVVDPIREDQGWRFTPEKDGCTPDSLHGADYLRELYVRADPDYSGRVTVPLLWDTESDTAVNNESEEVVKMLASAMAEYGSRDVNLYPEGRRDEIDEVIDDVYPAINNGVYRAGFAGTQEAYDRAVTELFDALERYDDLLADQRYLLGEELTLADVCMFTTLYRFDEVYHTHFLCNHRQITDYEHLWPYLRELYQLPGVAGTCRMDHCKAHYYRTHGELNPTGIVPVGPDPDFEAPHGRDRLPGGPPRALLGAAD